MKIILLIEDNVEIRENTAEILELANYKVVSAANGKLGVKIALELKPDLIVCDVMMPELDGYGVLHLLNRNSELAGIPFIFLTAKADRDDFRKGMEMGADDYVTKPFTDIELLNAIEARFRKTDVQKKSYESNEQGIKELLNDVNAVATLEDLTAYGNVNSYVKKQSIYQEGKYPNQLFYIKSGKVKTYKTSDTGKELTIDLYKEGDFIGYTALLENSKYNETAEALDNSELCVISKEDFQTLIESNPVVAQKFIQLLAKNVSEKVNQSLSLAYNSLRKRVANALIQLQDTYKTSEAGNFSMHISRADIANIAGTATESLIRTLSDFKAEGLIRINEGNITIMDNKKLSSLAN